MRLESNPNDAEVSWDLLTLIEARGFIEYVVELRAEGTLKRQTIAPMIVPMNQSSTTFTGLTPSTRYSATVSTRTPDLNNMAGPGE